MAGDGGAFERVHTMTDYYDGPRGGIADFRGTPHLYESEWRDDEGHEGRVPLSMTPVLPEDRRRSEELDRLLAAELRIDFASVVRARGEFRAIERPPAGFRGWPPLEVRWTIVEH
jgi:hypothetical protein